MKMQTLAGSLLATLLLTGCATEHHEHHADQARLMREARISKETAEQTALARVPAGTVKAGELEKEHGKLQWSFDLATPDTQDITEVNVDAVTGDVLSVQQESAESEAQEADQDKD